MSTVRVDLDNRSYDIRIEAQALKNVGPELLSIHKGGKAIIVSNTKVAALYAKTVSQSLDKAGIKNSLVTVPDGERFKTLRTVRKLYDSFIQAQLDRAGTVIALGGGVIGDMAGFAAGTFLRGVNLVQIPTTLLAQVDASVGGKTGVNLPQGKNLVGVFHQPKKVIIDLETLKTLPKRELRAGLAEVIKHGIIQDLYLLNFVQDNAQAFKQANLTALEVAVRRSCELKASIVKQDEREQGLRAVLNFGHTFAHVIESATSYKKYRHGEAVSIGMVAAAELSETIGLAEKGVRREIERTLRAVGLPIRLPSSLDPGVLVTAMGLDKKVLAGKKRFVLLKALGKTEIVENVDPEAIKTAIISVQEPQNG